MDSALSSKGHVRKATSCGPRAGPLVFREKCQGDHNGHCVEISAVPWPVGTQLTESSALGRRVALEQMSQCWDDVEILFGGDIG